METTDITQEETLELEAGFKTLGEAVEAMLLELKNGREALSVGQTSAPRPPVENRDETTGNVIDLWAWKRARGRF